MAFTGAIASRSLITASTADPASDTIQSSNWSNQTPSKNALKMNMEDSSAKFPVLDEAPKPRHATIVSAAEDGFEQTNHYYPKILNAEIHPLVNYFLNLSVKRIAERYCHLHPKVNKKALIDLLKSEPSHLRWSGADLFVTTTEGGKRQLTVIETNTCPSV